jgi:ABC-type uncharacterized transport system substrate-binding protein
LKINNFNSMKLIKIINCIIALAIAGGILLISDLQNRTGEKAEDPAFKTNVEYQAIPGKTYKIGMTYFGPDATFEMAMQGVWDGLKELGFVKDSNLIVIAQHANGEIANLQPIHLNMDNLDLDLILVTSTPGISAAVSAVKKNLVVFTMTYTPLEAGAGKSYTDHLPNMTGVGSFPPVEKTIDFIQEVFPDAKRIGTLYNSSEANSIKVIEVGRDYIGTKGLELVENTVTNTSEVFQAAIALCMRNIDVMWVTGDNTALQALHGIVKVCHDNKVPLILNDVDYVKYGALAAVGVGWYSTGVYSASFVARVLNGENPANIPIENYVEEEITLNHEVARELNVTFPEKYLSAEKEKEQKKNYKFCLVHYVDSPVSEDAERGIRDELKNQGMIEGEDFTLTEFNAQGDISILNNIVQSVANDKWDLIFTLSTPTIQMFSKKITDIPIVFSNVGDPIRAGLGKSNTEHNTNLTGISTMSNFEELVILVKESIPGIRKIGTIFTPGEINSVAYMEELEKAAARQGVELVTVPANSTSEVPDAARVLVNKGIGAFTQISDNLTASCGPSIIKVAYDTNTPYFSYVTQQITQGAIAIVSSDYYYAGIDAVLVAKKVLEGVSPGDIPFSKVSKSVVQVNKDAMNHFGVMVPEKYHNR